LATALKVTCMITHPLTKVYVPDATALSMARVAPASGVVAEPHPSGRLLAHYEGNLHGAHNMTTWADRVSHAAGRMRASYPTTALALVKHEDLVEVGSYDDQRGCVHLDPDPDVRDLVRAWLAGADLEAELLTTGIRHANRRYLETVPPGPERKYLEHFLKH
jgi:hypothetical protein